MNDLKLNLLATNLVIENNYLELYIRLIQDNKFTKKIKFFTQAHHVIPKYYFKLNNIPVDNSVTNLVNLSYADHLLAHYYLMKCSSSTYYELCNANAIFKNINNIHSVDFESWIDKNQELLNSINKRRCELISEHHVNVTGKNNPRATIVYCYDTNGAIIKSFLTINECAYELSMNPGSLRSLLSKNRIYLIQNKFLSKFDNLTKIDIDNFLAYRHTLENKKRIRYKVECQYCHKVYTKLLNPNDYLSWKDKQHVCAECSQTGIMFKGKAKSLLQRENMAKSSLGRKWVNNGIVAKQLKEPLLSEYLSNGWQLGKLKKEFKNEKE